MDRNEVFAVVCKQIQQNVHGVNGANVDPSSTLASYGATSLDIVEIVSGSMRELRVRVPRTELAKLKKIDDLVDLLYATKNASATIQ
jgi:acyl carrier protein